MIFDFDDVAYPVRQANLQRNSLVAAQLVSINGLVWSKAFEDFEPSLQPSPYAVLLSRSLIGVVSPEELLVFDSSGAFRYTKSRAENTPVVYGADAFAYVDPSYLLYYEDYNQKAIGDSHVIPHLEQWAAALLFRPRLEDVISVVMFTGGPQRKPPKVYASVMSHTLRPKWSFEEDGRLDDAFMTPDEKSLVLLQGGKFFVLNADDGARSESYETGLSHVGAACLGSKGNLILWGEDTGEEIAGVYLRACSIGGEKLWEYALEDPQDDLRPACGSDGRVYIVDSGQLKCLRDGEELWVGELTSPEPSLLTVASNNTAVVINGDLLCLFNADGGKVYEQLITNEAETFEAPAAVDQAGRIYIASDQRLYCFK